MSKKKNIEQEAVLNGEPLLSSPNSTVNTKKESAVMWRSIIIIALAIVIFVGSFFAIGVYFEKKSQKDDEQTQLKEPKAGMTYFTSEQSEPEKSDKELTALITEAYYTNDGSLAIRFCFANGMEKSQTLLSVEVKLRNGDGETIATGYSNNIKEGYTIPSGGTNTLLLYVSPEYVLINDDPLSTITYDVTTEYEPI